MNWRKLITNAVFFIQVLLIFLVIVENSVSLPFWLQPLGRMHPLILHFPVVLVLLIFALFIFQNKIDPKTYVSTRDILVLFTALTTSVTALFGFFLSIEEGYSGQLLNLHKWTGIGLSFLVYGILLSINSKVLFKYLSGASVLLVIVTGHMGANLTHGEDFLFEPIAKAVRPAYSETTPVFESVVMPVFEAKCHSCHNPQKHKGDLDMTSWEALTKGGESGPLWMAGDAMDSDMIKRILLEESHDDHMPPEGKAQLNKNEVAILTHWINGGASNEVALAGLDSSDSLFVLASQVLQAEAKEVESKNYTFDHASENVVELLNSPFRTVRQVTRNSPALDAHIFVRQAYEENFLSELIQVNEQLVNLNLSYLPIKDEELTTLANFNHLEKLILNYTDITTDGIGNLGTLENLEILALIGTQVDESIEDHLSNFPNLKELYVWDTEVSEEKVVSIQENLPKLMIDEGYKPHKDLTLIISPPELKNNATVLAQNESIELEHTVSGTEIYYTIDGSEPDSSSTKYSGPFPLSSAAVLKAIAYKEGWQPSKVNSFTIFMRGKSPQRITLQQPTNQKYKGKGEISLTDGLKGDITQFQSSEWLGFQETNFDALVDFGSAPPPLERIVLSYGSNIINYIMKPTQLQLYGGNSSSSLRLLHTKNLETEKDYGVNEEYSVDIPAKATYRYYRVVAKPIQSLPEWHVGKGSQGWVFVDEIFFY